MRKTLHANIATNMQIACGRMPIHAHAHTTLPRGSHESRNRHCSSDTHCLSPRSACARGGGCTHTPTRHDRQWTGYIKGMGMQHAKRGGMHMHTRTGEARGATGQHGPTSACAHSPEKRDENPPERVCVRLATISFCVSGAAASGKT